MNRVAGLSLIAAVFAGLLCSCDRSVPRPVGAGAKLIVRETCLTRIPVGAAAGDEQLAKARSGVAGEIRTPMMAVSQDARRVAFVAARGEKARMVVDGVAGNDYDFIMWGPVFSVNGKHVAYAASKGGETFVVLDGMESPAYESAHDFTFSRRGGRFAYVAARDGKEFVVLDGTEGEKHECIGELVLSPSGARLAYVVGCKWSDQFGAIADGLAEDLFGNRSQHRAKEPSPRWVIVDDTEYGPYHRAGALAFSTSGKRFAFMARRGDKEFVAGDAMEGKKYEAVGSIQQSCWNESEPLFSPVGEHLVYFAVRDGRQFVVLSGVEGKAYDQVYGLEFSPDDTRVAYVAKRGERELVVVDGVEHEAFDWIDSRLIFSPDGRRLAYSAGNASRDADSGGFAACHVLLDGARSRRFDGVAGLVFSPDSRRFAYTAWASGKGYVCVDGGERCHDNVDEWVLFSPDSKRVAYVAERDRSQLLVVDGVEAGPHDWILDCVFSPDSRRVAYVAARGEDLEKAKQFVVVDGVAGKKYECAAWIPGACVLGNPVAPPGRRLPPAWFSSVGPVFSPDSRHVAYAAMCGGKVLLVIDGRETGRYDGVVGIDSERPVMVVEGSPLKDHPVAFMGSCSLRALVLRGGRILRVEIEIVEGD